MSSPRAYPQPYPPPRLPIFPLNPLSPSLPILTVVRGVITAPFLFIFPFESLPPAKTVLFLAPLGVSDLQLGPGSLQAPISAPGARLGRGARKMLSNLHRVSGPGWAKSGLEGEGVLPLEPVGQCWALCLGTVMSVEHVPTIGV